MGRPKSTLASTLRRAGTSTWSVAASHSRSRLRRRRWIRGLRRAEGEITPLTTTGTTTSPGTRRAKRAPLEEQRSTARYILLSLDAGVAGESFQRPGTSSPQARLADYSVVGQDLACQTPGWYARDRFH